MKYDRVFRALTLVLSLIAIVYRCTPADAAMRTANKYVSATVEEATGLLTIYEVNPVPNRPDINLSYTQRSFLTVLVGDKYFTSNPFYINPPFGAAQLLSNAALTRLTDSHGNGNDTIRCTWAKLNNVDIIQDVFPVEFSRSGQIVVRLWARNQNGIGVNVQAQYLLDVEVAGNDKAKILTRFGYKPTKTQFTTTTPGGIPPYYLSFQNDLPGVPVGNYGAIGQGYTDFPLLGLRNPFRFTIGDWNDMVNFLWGPPTNMVGDYGDNAELYEWSIIQAQPGRMTELGSFSYGTGEPELCPGRVLGLTFYQHKLYWDKTKNKYNPDTLLVETYAFNTDKVESASKIKLTLNVDPRLKIVVPNDATNNGLTETQAPSPDIADPQSSPAIGTWKIIPSPNPNCTHDDTVYFKLTGHSSFDPVTFLDTCPQPVILECPNFDRDAPIVNNIDSSKTFQWGFDVHDDRAGDFGLDSILYTFTGKQPSDQSKFTYTVTPSFTAGSCSKGNYHISIIQQDSTVGGCFAFTFIDCAKNKKLYDICFATHSVASTPDTVAPRFTFISGSDSVSDKPCGYRCDSVFVRDDNKADKGLRSITVDQSTTAINMGLTVVPFPAGTPFRGFQVCISDSMLPGSITIVATDEAGNSSKQTYTYCPVPDTIKPGITITPFVGGVAHVHVYDNRAWDRGIDKITPSAVNNVTFSPNPSTVVRGAGSFDFDATIVDRFKNASFCLTASDTAGNIADQVCRDDQTSPDTLAPNIIKTDVGSYCIDIDVNDLHPGYTWDRGVDSIWFTDGKGMVVPSTIFRHFLLNDTTIRICVIDTLDTSCVTIHAIDGGANTTALTWCYPSAPDDLPPVIQGTAATYQSLSFEVSDSLAGDRGLRAVTLSLDTNFSPYSVTQITSRKMPVTLQVKTPGQSAVGRLSAIDNWGANSPSPVVQQAHSADVDVAIWILNLAMQKSLLAETAQTVTIPVNIVKIDSFPTRRKAISKFQFSFDITGDYGVSFVGIDQKNTATALWTVTSNVVGNRVTITGVAPKDSVLWDDSKPLINLQLFTPKSESTKQSILSGVINNGFSVVYNDGLDVVVRGKNATAILPAPLGSISGAHVVIRGSCSPLATSETMPTIVSLDNPHPNPFTHSTTIEYTVPEVAHVDLIIYDQLGNEVNRLKGETQAPGAYKAVLDGEHLHEGIYYVRLQVGAKVITRQVHVSK